MNSPSLTYVLITPARNEEAALEQTIQSVLSQTVLPQKWVIVSDGSTDHTDNVVERHLRTHSWMELVRMPERNDRHFGGKVQSFNAGLERLRGHSFDIIGNLDADISFGPDYFEYLLSKFAADPALGVAGTPFVEGNTAYDYRFTSIEHVSGACQLFRRECFEQIGGYMPVKTGGIDWIAVTTARMKGWKTRTFLDRLCYHHRLMGTASGGVLRATFKLGQQDYYLGGHPLWQFARTLYQFTKPPYGLGGALLFLGYCWAWLTQTPRPVSAELIRFHRHEQLTRLAIMLHRVIRQKGAAPLRTSNG